MKKIKHLLIFVLGFASSFLSNGQAKLVSGSVSGLKGVNIINIEYDYSQLAVGEFNTEEGYLEKKRQEYYGVPDKLEEFKAKWYNARRERYEPKFEENFSKFGSRFGITGKNYSKEAPITLMVSVIFIEPGFNIGIAKKNASVNFECTFVDARGAELCRYTIYKVKGSEEGNYDFATESRIASSFGSAALYLTRDLKKRFKKMK